MLYLFSFLIALLALYTASALLFFTRKNLRGRCSNPEDCETCKRKCSRKEPVDEGSE